MLGVKRFYSAVVENGISFFTGVPDSLLKDFCAYVTDHVDARNHVIAANEGNAIALAVGSYLATGNPGLVYMQNSGLGNAVNPLTSLVDPAVFSIPVLLVIGWRGEPGTRDQVHHIKDGEVTLPLLETLEIEHCVLPYDAEGMSSCLNKAVQAMCTGSRPCALVVRRGTFEPYKVQSRVTTLYEMSREECVKVFAGWHKPRDAVVSTTGKTSRELSEYRVGSGEECLGQDFRVVGSMGHVSQIALGVALEQPNRQVYCLDGDGALIMHMGSLAVIGGQQPRNLKHIVINNGAHDSVGGQSTVGFDIDIPAIARACGYVTASQVERRNELRSRLDTLRESRGPALLEIRVRKGARSDLGRPTTTPAENKKCFMEFLQR